MSRFPLLFSAGLLLALVSCGLTPQAQPAQLQQQLALNHTRAYVIEQIEEVLGEGWDLEPDPENHPGEIVTRWRENLAPMTSFGRRNRLRVKVEGELPEPYTISVSQDTEKNMNQDNPLSSGEAEWQPAETDGALAERFWFALMRRFDLRERWREEEGR